VEIAFAHALKRFGRPAFFRFYSKEKSKIWPLPLAYPYPLVPQKTNSQRPLWTRDSIYLPPIIK
jgi:hypothetical protein